MRQTDWYLVSSHGAVLFCIAADPGCTVTDLAETLCLTRRTIWGKVGDLRRAGMLEVRKNGRRHHYTVNLDANFPHPTIEGCTLGHVMRDMVKRARRSIALAVT